MLWFVRAIGIVSALVLLVALYMQFGRPRFIEVGEQGGKLPGGFSGHMLAMEFISSADDIKAIVGAPGHPNRVTMRRKIAVDNVWIGCYALLFVFVSILLGTRQFPSAMYLAMVAALCGIAAAGFDLIENRGIIRALELAEDATTSDALSSIREAALLKWALVFVSMAILAITFFGRDGWLSFIGYCFATTALVGVVGLWRNPLLGLSSLPMAVGLLLLTAQALWRAERFLP